MTLNPLQKRRIAAFKANKRAFWSLWIFLILFGLSLFAELLANDKPLVISYRGELSFPVFADTYEESEFGGDPGLNADFTDMAIQCLIRTGGIEDCYYEPEDIIAEAESGTVAGEPVEAGWIIWAPIPYSFDTVNDDVFRAPSAPDANHILGTDDTTRDVLARVIYGVRTSLLFAIATVGISSMVGIVAGAIQGFFGGWVDLLFQRFIEIWGGVPFLYVIIITAAVFTMNFWLLVALMSAFSWTALVGVVRAEFLRARNFEYVRAARALGVSDRVIMFRHILPNAMVATLTLMPFLITGAIGGLATLDFLGFGLPSSYPSLGEVTLQARENLQMPSLAFTAFITFAVLLSLLVFIFEGVRDAFDPRKVLA
ncbi:microcin C transport system permease protein [Monaibacterium marinum]|uniref:Microcin C transport system permease protein n=1 Tax=Pontivivens marinum TaxID=1690039 RepID=A0A2C9CMU5_9RHOB|nr:ABC transporter permease [Monaibacterium marinum]SOH92515.1 microcin C transport system permease protein [Monaibacterium marinum]